MDHPALEQLRENAASVPPAPAAMATYLERVRTRAYTITDAEVEALRATGLSEDVIFEQTVAAAIGEGLRRIDGAREVLD